MAQAGSEAWQQGKEVLSSPKNIRHCSLTGHMEQAVGERGEQALCSAHRHLEQKWVRSTTILFQRVWVKLLQQSNPRPPAANIPEWNKGRGIQSLRTDMWEADWRNSVERWELGQPRLHFSGHTKPFSALNTKDWKHQSCLQLAEELWAYRKSRWAALGQGQPSMQWQVWKRSQRCGTEEAAQDPEGANWTVWGHPGLSLQLGEGCAQSHSKEKWTSRVLWPSDQSYPQQPEPKITHTQYKSYCKPGTFLGSNVDTNYRTRN